MCTSQCADLERSFEYYKLERANCRMTCKIGSHLFKKKPHPISVCMYVC